MKFSMKRIFHICLVACLLAPAAARAETMRSAPAENANRRLTRDDVVFVRIPIEPELSGEYKIDENGMLFLPVIEGLDLGTINAAQYTPAQLAEEITRRLKARNYNMSDSANRVTVELMSFAIGVDYVVSIYGAVAHPSAIPYFPDMTILDLIIRCGGVLNTADLSQARYISTDPATGLRVSQTLDITRLDTGEDLKNNLTLQPGDYLIIPTRKPEAEQLVSIFGQVGKPGVYPYVPGMKLFDLFVDANSITEKADLKTVRLVRDGAPVTMDATEVLNGTDLSANIELKNGDSVIVPQQEPQAKIKIIVLGQVSRVGTVYLPEGSTVLDAIGAVEGLTGRAGAGKTYLIRMVDGTPTAVPVDLKALINRLDLAQNHILRDGDVYFVPDSGGIHISEIMQNLSLFNLIDSTISTVEKDISD